jgi:hypothetical protein
MFFKVERTEPHDIFCIKVLFCPIDNKILLSVVRRRPVHVQYSYPHLPSFHSLLLTLLFPFYFYTIHFQIHTPPSSTHYVLFLHFLILSSSRLKSFLLLSNSYHIILYRSFVFSTLPIMFSLQLHLHIQLFFPPSRVPSFPIRSFFLSFPTPLFL